MSESGAQADQPQGNVADESPDLNKIARWVAEIELYDRETATWRKQSKRIIKRYKDDRGDQDSVLFGARFNAFWANVQTMRPSLYARNPKPDIQRRFKDADPVGRVASDILERCASYFTDTDLFYEANSQALTDYLLPGRGTVWERYVPHLSKVEPALDQEAKADGEITDDVDDDAEVPEEITFEESITDYVHMNDFGHNICRVWSEVWCAWRIVYLDRHELVDRFGEEKGNLVALDYKAKDINDQSLADGVGKAVIYELWDKTRKCAVWFHKSMPKALDVRKDPLKLDGFWPFPKPIFTNLANDSLIPTPDFIESQDQYLELDDLTTRIAAVTKALKVAGVYDASAEGVGRLLNEGVENKLIPVESWAMFAEKGGLQGVINFLPIKDVSEALLALYQARDKVKEDLHEISGIPDIARGDSDANETLGAQEIKTSFAVNRISDKQRDIQRFVKDTVRIKVDIICGHFQLETIKKISGVKLFTAEEKAQIQQFQQAMQHFQQAQQQAQQAPPQQPPQPQPGMQPPQMPPPQPPQPPPAMQGVQPDQLERMMSDPTWDDVERLLRDDAMRSFRIDIETDSTIKADEQQDKASRIEFVSTIGKYMESAIPAGQQTPELVPFLLEGLMFLARGFPVGKTMESALNLAITKLEKIAANPPPKQDPEMIKIQGQQQLDQSKLQGEMQLGQMRAQIDQQKVQGDIQVARAKAQADAQVAQATQAAQAAQDQNSQQMQAHREQEKMMMEERLAMSRISMESDLQLKIAHIKAAASIEVARINAKADDGAAAEAREVSGE
jgi:hypothetical protein